MAGSELISRLTSGCTGRIVNDLQIYVGRLRVSRIILRVVPCPALRKLVFDISSTEVCEMKLQIC